MNIYNKKKNGLVLDEDPMQQLDDTKATAEAKHSVNFSRIKKKICLKSEL